MKICCFFFCYYKFLLFEGGFSLLVYLYYKKEQCEVNDLKLIFFIKWLDVVVDVGLMLYVIGNVMYVCVLKEQDLIQLQDVNYVGSF